MKRFFPLFLAALLSLAACAPAAPSSVAPPSPSSEATASPLGDSSETGEPTSQDQPRLMVADAAMYRGTVVSIEDTSDGRRMVLEQAEGTDYGSPSHSFLLTENSTLSFPEDQLIVGSYLEVFYGVPMGQAPDPTEVSQAIAINRYPEAAMVVFNGTLKSIETDAAGKGNMVLIQLGTEQEVVFHFDESTQFYLNKSELTPGVTLNLLHRGAFTMSIPPQGTALEVWLYHDAK